MKKKLIIFDLDGVLIDSKKNMEISWNGVCKKFDLEINFKKYFSLIGLPFEEILKKLGIKNNFKKIKSTYSYISKKNFNRISVYPKVINTLTFLKNNHIKIAIVTSKDKQRTKKNYQTKIK